MSEIERLKGKIALRDAEIARLRSVCGEAYQAIGVMAHRLGWWKMEPEHPWHQPIEKLLDNISAGAEGEPIPHADLVPFILVDMPS